MAASKLNDKQVPRSSLIWTLCFMCLMTEVAMPPVKGKNNTSISANAADAFISLPCDAPSQTWNVKWYKIEDGRREIIAKFGKGNSLLSYGKYKNRVGRGDKAEMFLIGPTPEDSGNYECDVNLRDHVDWFPSIAVPLDVTPSEKPKIDKPPVYNGNRIQVTDTNRFVTIPCKVTSSLDEDCPEVEWWRITNMTNGNLKELVMNIRECSRVETFNLLYGRAAAGDKGDLILLRPYIKDSGKYRCSIKQTNDQWRYNDTELLVTQEENKDGVTIVPGTDLVQAKHSDSLVLLRCNFTTDSNEIPKVAWYRHQDGQTEKVVECDSWSNMRSYGKFEGRVELTRSGGLLLFRPTTYDSGVYTCYVSIGHGVEEKVNISLAVSTDNYDAEIVLGKVALLAMTILSGWIIFYIHCADGYKKYKIQKGVCKKDLCVFGTSGIFLISNTILSGFAIADIVKPLEMKFLVSQFLGIIILILYCIVKSASPTDHKTKETTTIGVNTTDCDVVVDDHESIRLSIVETETHNNQRKTLDPLPTETRPKIETEGELFIHINHPNSPACPEAQLLLGNATEQGEQISTSDFTYTDIRSNDYSDLSSTVEKRQVSENKSAESKV